MLLSNLFSRQYYFEHAKEIEEVFAKDEGIIVQNNHCYVTNPLRSVLQGENNLLSNVVVVSFINRDIKLKYTSGVKLSAVKAQKYIYMI